MISIRITQDTLTPDLLNKQREFSAADMRQTMAEVGREFVNISRESFGASKSNRPSPWPPLSPKYQKRINYYGPPTLQQTGKLMNSIQIGYVQPTSVTVETQVDYAAVHQFGGGNNIPARPYFPIINSGNGEYELTPYALDKIRKVLEMRFR